MQGAIMDGKKAYMKERRAPLILVLLISLGTLSHTGNSNEWVNHGNGILNQRSAIGPGLKINRETVRKLELAWTFKTGFDVTATPCVGKGRVFFPGSNGMLYAVDEKFGELIWQKNLTELAGQGTVGLVISRATPVLWRNLLIVSLRGPPVIVAVNCHTGSLLWRTPHLDSTQYAIITMSGTAYKGFYYVGTSSQEESATCCTFQGSFQKIRIKDGTVVWRTEMLPPNSGYYGAALWGSSPSIDEKRQLVFIATGNNYKVPKSVEQCENARSSGDLQSSPDPCLDPHNHLDSMLALSLDTGAIVWSRNLLAFDVWTIPCQLSPNTPNCPSILGPDYDFGEAPMIIYFDTSPKTNSSSNLTCLVVAAQKSGVVWALDCDTGSIVWSTAAGPGGTLGGASWGSSTDGERVYTSIINNEGRNFTLVPSQEVTKGGGWVAMQAKTGKVVWTIAEPSGALAIGPMSTAQGVVFGTSFSVAGDIFALDALTGSILWHASTGASIYGGASISGSCLFLGNGLNSSFPNAGLGTSVSAFCLPISS